MLQLKFWHLCLLNWETHHIVQALLIPWNWFHTVLCGLYYIKININTCCSHPTIGKVYEILTILNEMMCYGTNSKSVESQFSAQSLGIYNNGLSVQFPPFKVFLSLAFKSNVLHTGISLHIYWTYNNNIPCVVDLLNEFLEHLLYHSQGLSFHQHMIIIQQTLQSMLQRHVFFFHLPALHSFSTELLWHPL